MALAGKSVKPKVQKVRRIVTGMDRNGRSVIVSDRASPHVMALQGIPRFGVTDLWRTASTPADPDEARDLCSVPTQLAPPRRGSVLRVVEFAPDKLWIRKADGASALASMGESGSAALAHGGGGARHPMMHATQTIDYAIILKGEIWALLDVGETKMKAGDILIQRATSHAWSNRSNKPCLVAFILIDAKPAKKKK